MSEKIRGDAEIFKIYSGGAYIPVACLTSNGLSESRTAIESQTKCNPGVITKTPGTYTYEGDVEGEYIKPESGLASWVELSTLIRDADSSIVEWNITTTYADASTLEEYGTALITDLSKTAPAGDELITFSATLSGSGTITNTNPNPII